MLDVNVESFKLMLIVVINVFYNLQKNNSYWKLSHRESQNVETTLVLCGNYSGQIKAIKNGMRQRTDDSRWRNKEVDEIIF